jgi:hypothetical protein
VAVIQDRWIEENSFVVRCQCRWKEKKAMKKQRREKERESEEDLICIELPSAEYENWDMDSGAWGKSA